MDLRKKGLLFTLEKGMDIEPFLKEDYIQRGQFSYSRGIFEFPSGRYSTGIKLGSGGYGKVYFVTDELSNTVSAVKVLDFYEYEKWGWTIHGFLRLGITQALINIILEEESKDEPNGPYVPEFYEIAYDAERKYILLRFERILDTLRSRYIASTEKENEKIIPQTLAQISYILEFFEKRLQYNHRDLKNDNIMYNYLPSGEFQVKIIDFGFSCLNYYGTILNSTEYFTEKHKCHLLSRDLSFLIYTIFSDTRIRMSPKLRGVLEFLLTFPIDNKECKLYDEFCEINNMRLRIDMNSLYDILNNKYIEIMNTKTTPTHLRVFMMRLLGIKVPKKTSPIKSILSKKIPGLPYCPVFKVLNPRTRRCVHRDSQIGRRILKESQKGLKYPFTDKKYTRRRNLKPCKPNQTRNPFTHRCHKRAKSTPFTPETRFF
jgi:serine/threonine protein kinase